jgi:hypothetical protein
MLLRGPSRNAPEGRLRNLLREEKQGAVRLIAECVTTARKLLAAAFSCPFC